MYMGMGRLFLDTKTEELIEIIRIVELITINQSDAFSYILNKIVIHQNLSQVINKIIHKRENF